MRVIPMGILTVCLLVGGWGCPGPVTSAQDAGTHDGMDGGDPGSDAGGDQPGDGGGDEIPSKPTTAYHLSSGGGKASSATYKAFIRIGAPQPMGKAENAQYKLKAGPRPLP